MTTLSFITAAPAVFLSAIGQDLGMSLADKGLFLSAGSWGFIGGMLVAGPLADRIGFRALLCGSVAILGGGLLLMGFAASQPAAVVAVVVGGAGCGVNDALLTPVVCAVYPERRTHVSNLLHAFYGVGLIGTTLLMLLLMRLEWTWQSGFAVLAALAVPFVVLFAIIPLPRHSHAAGRRLPTRRIALSVSFLMLCGGMFVAGFTEIGPGKWLPNFVEATTGGGQAHGAVSLLLFAVALTAGRLAGSAAMNRMGPRWLLVAGGAICTASILLASAGLGAAFTILWLAVLGLGVSVFWPTLLGMAGDRFPQAGASMYSLLSAFGSAGAIVGPWLVGVTAEAAGSLRLAMMLTAIAPASAIVLALWLRPAAAQK